jgi:hypothetical protein
MAGTMRSGLTISELVQARIGHFHHADVGLDGAEGIVLGGDAGLGQGVEKSGLAHVGQAHDAAFEAHGNSLCINALRHQTWRKCPIRIVANPVLFEA